MTQELLILLDLQISQNFKRNLEYTIQKWGRNETPTATGKIYSWAWTEKLASCCGYNVPIILKSTKVVFNVQGPWYSQNTPPTSLPSVWRLNVNTSYAGGTILPMPHCIEDKHLVIYVIKENDCKRGTDLAYNCFPLILGLYHIVFYFSFSFVSDLLEDIIVHFLIIEWSILHIG